MFRVLTLCILLLFVLIASAQQQNVDLKIEPVTKDVFLYTTYNVYKGARISANALYVVTSAGVVLIDSPWDSTQFQPLLDSIRVKHDKKVVLCVATHFHEDRTGGLEYYRQQGIATYTTVKTDQLSKQKGMKRAQHLMTNDSTFKIGQYSFQFYYPGPGHAPDNIVVWLDNQQLLYGGCLVKSTVDKTLGNLADADISQYAKTIRKLKDRYSRAKFVIPGHNDWKDPRSVDYTLQMAEELSK